jgi:hypothetical protein
MKILHLITLILTGSVVIHAQQGQMPLDQTYNYRLERHLNKAGVGFHTLMKPYLESEVLQYIPADARKEMGITAYNEYFSGDSTADAELKEGLRFSARRGDLLQIQKKKVYIGINPLVDFIGGYDLKEKTTLFGSSIRR